MGTPPHSDSAQGKLSAFQQTMLQWCGVHPYNAVHVIRVERKLTLDRLRSAVEHVLKLTGLNRCRIDEKRGRYSYEEGAAQIQIAVSDGGDDPFAALSRVIENELNQPFDWKTSFEPFRFFLITAGESSFLGLVYFHAVADADSVSRVLGEVIEAYCDSSPQPLRDQQLSQRKEWRIPRGSPLAQLKRMAFSFQKFQRMRRCFRSPDCPTDDAQCNWFGRSLDTMQTAKVLALAHRHGATVNDLCLAALLRAVVPFTWERHGTRRSQIAAGCVVNLRGELPECRRRDFGLYLGSFSVTHPVPEEASLIEVLKGVSAQTQEVKRRKSFLASRLEFSLGRIFYARQKPESRRNFYRKVYPTWGSITNFRIKELGGCAASEVSDYIRAVSTGPALPFVIGVTGFAGRLNLGFTYRPRVVPSEMMKEIAERFIDLITERRVS